MASAARHVAARSIHIKMYPTARSFPERREVLRVLERFGEVEMFKSLKYNPTSTVPNAFLSILSTEEAAQAAIEASPIRYRLVADPAPPLSSFSLQDRPPLESSPPTAPPPATVSETIFELHISPSRHRHRTTITSSPLHGTYKPVTRARSPIASALAERIPGSIGKSGLMDWVTGSVHASSGERATAGAGGFGEGAEDQEERAAVQWGRACGGGAGWEEFKKPWRLRDRERVELESRIPWVMKGLKLRPQSASRQPNQH